MKNNSNNNNTNTLINGIHHITAICSNPQKNIDFYTQLLGLRLVKLTVNFDDPTTYHLYYGDEVGHPGTILTFFPWPDAPKGYRGTGQAITTSFLVPPESIDFWKNRLKNNDICFEGPTKRFGNEEQIIKLYDPDGLELELVAHSSAKENDEKFWKDGPITFENGIRGFYSVSLSEEGYERTSEILKDMGYKMIKNEANRFRFQLEDSQSNIARAKILDVLCLPYTPYGRIGIGTVHHIAFRTLSDETQIAIRDNIIKIGLNPTPVIDRTYFHSVYFREPGGVLFEIATDSPGFIVDQKVEDLGERLMLPKSLESVRERLEKVLPKIEIHHYNKNNQKKENKITKTELEK
ncbi:MAG TPA: ring-cleaving dioxygenase [Nitrososphaeraceae archaeon]|nr:ring-cleaving dioxygenase [Nitrososphaeraceae archaeon]